MESYMEFDWVLEEGARLGADYVSLLYQETVYESFTADNRNVREVSRRRARGLGIQVLRGGGLGFASTSMLDRDNIQRCLRKALATASAVGKVSETKLAEAEPVEDRVVSRFKIDPLEIDFQDKIDLVLEANKAAFIDPRVKSATTRLAVHYDRRIVKSTEGTDVEVRCFTTGLSHLAVAYEAGVMERVPHQRAKVAGWEFIEEFDWGEFTADLSRLACKAVGCKTPPPGSYTVVVDPEIIGILLHEAFGHASEGDLVASGASILKGRLGEKVASELVTVVDEGVVEGGYFVPYDDEGVPKRRTVVVDKGVLRGFLTSRRAAAELGGEDTGNGRCQDFQNLPIVRQTNYYMLPGDMGFEELLEDVDFGIYIRGVGATGGQVDTGMGMFTFSVGPSYMVRNGELAEMVRGVVISGFILDVLKEVDAVAEDLRIRTSVFGGCGKDGQMVRVGFGGPHIRVRRMTVGGGG
ncbi:TldD/PmbA family protein [Candidatus Bathyarchaeota archaeon]|nr:MAG: TldD/PmbA family protein [Candidatus Bathyarchaeota archaeon]